MAFIINSQKDMIRLVKHATAALHDVRAEMLIVPVLQVEDVTDAKLDILLEVPAFSPRRKDDDLPDGAAGVIRINTERTVDEALDEMETLSLVDMGTLVAAMECAASLHVPGKTRLVDLGQFGKLPVDVEQFAKRTGLPAKSAAVDMYATFLLKVPDNRADNSTRIMLVAIKGTTDTAAGCGGPEDALVPMVSRLECRAREAFDTPADFFTRELADGWQLYHNKLFRDFLGWLRSCHYYNVTRDENRRGLVIEY
ncbi:MAG TPA: hypothetical protein V6D08_03500 [Candidatus Obscuribacterales bacterium]